MNALTLDFDRTTMLMRNDVRINLRGLLTAIGAVVGAFLVFDLIGLAFGQVPEGRDGTFAVILVIGGYIITSTSFADLHDAKKATHYLTLPGSTIEKYLGRLVLTTVGWSIATIVFYMTATALSAAIGLAVFGRAGEVFLPVTRTSWEAIGSYIVTQSVFFFGAVYFKKHHFLKTVLSTVVIAFVFALVAMVVMRIVFIGEFAGLLPTEAELERVFGDTVTLAVRRFAEVMEVIGKIVYWAVVPLYFWILGYRRMRETEVRS